MVDFSIINAAATRTGNDPITALDEGSIVANVATNSYEEVVASELSLYPWKRASKTATLNRLDPDVHGDPAEPWTAAYALPSDFIDVRTVMVGGSTISYAVSGDTILTDASEDDVVVLHYIWRVDEVEWPPWFREGVIRRMEAMFLRAVGERYREAQARDEAADEQFQKARNRDSQSVPGRSPVGSPLLRARGGLVGPAGPYDPFGPSWPYR